MQLSQSEVLIKQFVKQADGRWLLNELRAGETLELQQAGGALAVDELYFKILPDGTEPALEPLDRIAGDLEEAHRAACDASLTRGLAQSRVDETVSAKAVMARLNAKRQAS